MPSCLADERAEDRVLLVVLSADVETRCPIASAEVGVGVYDLAALIEARAEGIKADSFRSAPQVLAGVLNERTWSVEGLLVGLEVLFKSHDGQAWNCHCTARNAAAAVDHVKPEPIGQVVFLCLMHFD